jgi:hypothetical protein
LGHFRPAQLGATTLARLGPASHATNSLGTQGYVHPQGRAIGGEAPPIPGPLWTNWRCTSRLVCSSALQSSLWLPRWIVPRLLVWGWNAARCLTRGEVRTCAQWNCCQGWPGTRQESRCHPSLPIQFGIAGHRLVARTGEAAIDAGLQGTTSCISAS